MSMSSPHLPVGRRRRRARGGGRPGTISCAAVLLVGLLACVCALARPQAALAGTWIQATCQNPDGSEAPGEGWSSDVIGTPGFGSNVSTSCPMFAELSMDAGARVGDGEDLQYDHPSGSRLVGGEVDIDAHADGHGYNASGVAVIYTPELAYDAANVIFQCDGDFSPCELLGTPVSANADYSGRLTLPADRGGFLYLGAECGGDPGEVCNEGGSEGAWSRIELLWARLILESSATPAAGAVSGPLLSGPVTGAQPVTVLAEDPDGPGVYRMLVTADGTILYEGTPDTNDGHCVPHGSSGGALVFDYAQPCRRSESVTVAVATGRLHDGTHDLTIELEDAAGNTATVENIQITTDNAPAALTAPTITGAAVVGSTLSATPATFSVPAEAGTLSTLEGRWLRCSDQAAERCSPIPEADGESYTPSGADVGYRLVYADTASDSDGSTTSTSAPTVAVVEPTKSAAGAGGQSGVGSSGGDGIARSAGGSGGSGTADGGLTVNLDTSTEGMLGSTSPWQVKLKVTPRQVHKGTTIKLTGTVSTKPRPAKGVLLYLRARSIVARAAGRHAARNHRHGASSHGRWITFVAVRTRANGTFEATHRFRLGGRHTYQFEAVAPQEGGYLNSTGRSRIVTVHERPGRGGRAGRRRRR